MSCSIEEAEAEACFQGEPLSLWGSVLLLFQRDPGVARVSLLLGRIRKRVPDEPRFCLDKYLELVPVTDELAGAGE